MYRYIAHGLHIASDLACPELLPLETRHSPPNVTIQWGEAPEELDNPTKQTVLYQAKAQQFLLKLPQIARYWVRDGCEIMIQPAADAPQETIRLFLFGSAFGALLHQRGQLILHGSAVETAQGAAVFVGPVGHGQIDVGGSPTPAWLSSIGR